VLVLLLFAVVLAAGCSSGPLFVHIEAQPTLDVSWSDLSSSDGLSSLSRAVVTVPGRVDTVAYDPEFGLLLIGYEDGALKSRRGASDLQYAACDVGQSAVRWAARGRPRIERLGQGILVLASLDKNATTVELFDAATGEFIRESPSGLQFAGPEGIPLVHEYKVMQGGAEFTRVDVRTGEEQWVHELCDYPRNAVLHDGWYYSVGLNCLDAFRLADGEGWRVEVPTSNSAEAAGKYAMAAAAGCLFGMVSPITVMPTTSVIEHHFSPPLVVGDRIYFAAREKLLCLRQESGAIIWETPLSNGDHGSMFLLELDGDICLVAQGWLRKNQYSDNAREPEVFLFSSETGELLSRFAPDCRDYEVIRGVLPTDSTLLVLTTDTVYQLDHNLLQRASLERTMEAGWFIGFAGFGDPVVARTQHGLLGFGRSSFEPAWFCPIEETAEEPEPKKRRRNRKAASPDTFALRWEAAREEAAQSHDTVSAAWFWAPDVLYALDRSHGEQTTAEAVLAFRMEQDWKLEGFVGSAAVAVVDSCVMLIDLEIKGTGEAE
jgi:outer membrane protein assembly factor BamB